jgi:hypothetical protein
MSILANRMKSVAPSSQVSNLLTANFNVPSRGKQTVVGTVAQLKIAGTPEGFGFGVTSGGAPVVWLRDPADSKSVVLRLSSDMTSITWQRKIDTTDSPGDYTNSMGLGAGDHPLIWNNSGAISINIADGTNRQVKTLPSPWYSFNAIKALTTSNEGIINGWAVSGSGTAVTQRFNTNTGTVTWGHQASSGEGPPFNQGMGIAESPDGSVISYGVRVQGSTQDSYTIRRVNFSNGGLIWQYKYYDPVRADSWEPGVMVESNSNLLVGLQERHLVALNTSDGSIAWQKKIGTGTHLWHDIVWDSNSNYYFGCLRSTSEFVAIDVLGNFVYSRQLTSLSGTLRIRGIRTDATWVYLFLVCAGGAYVVKLPKDGSGLAGVASFPDGQEITYSATTLTVTTPSHSRFSSNVSVGSVTTTGTTTLGNNASTAFTLNSGGI